jgi:hypothetical protein
VDELDVRGKDRQLPLVGILFLADGSRLPRYPASQAV